MESDETRPAGLFELGQYRPLALVAEQGLVLDFGLKFEAAIALGSLVMYALHTLYIAHPRKGQQFLCGMPFRNGEPVPPERHLYPLVLCSIQIGLVRDG